MTYTTNDIRNIALIGHTGVGKTILTERLLYTAGAINTMGSISRGSTLSDFDEQEKAQGHSLYPAVCSLDYQNTHINLLDTPGFPDFSARAMSVLAAADAAALVINAAEGVEMVAERLMESAKHFKLCRMIIVNHIDSQQINYQELIEQIQSTFGEECLPLNLPVKNGEAVTDCYFSPDENQQTDFSSVEEAHNQLIDQVVEVDDQLMELYLEQGESLSPGQLHDPFEKALRENHLIPICFTSAETGAGIKELLQIFKQLMPSPLESNLPQFIKGEGEKVAPVKVVADSDKHVIAHVFKVAVDPYVGKLAMFRIHQGTIKPDTQLFIGDNRKAFKVSHLLKLQGKKSQEISKGIPGDICAVAKVNEIEYDNVLHDSHDEDHYHLIPIDLPPPMHGLAIEPVRRGDEQKLSDALHKIVAEDPTLVVEQRVAMNETVLRGQGELHLKIILEKMHQQMNVAVATRPPSIAYRETITQPAAGHSRHKKQTGGAGQFGEVFLKVEPLERGAGFEFVNQITGGVIPSQFIPAVEKGVKQVLEGGAIAGYPLQDVRVMVYDGKHHPVDSKEIAFVSAGKKAFLDAIDKAKPVILEPTVNLEITAPAQCMGDISGDIASFRGIISGTEALPGGKIKIKAQVTLREISDYQSRLKSLTGGEGFYSMTFSHYGVVPADLQQALIKEYHQHKEAS
ncbi:elongation factor G [Endozoicomonas sp. SM1973]|uniref:Elongation factor G n=1 Tax=Spartinivicinus marinus TaxID=2994442 RepID=A0A853I8W2_9GAMM|nr:elongation factor G [Spartinivicinus marinus]MCX4024652.1 elongation factor G [Spartinivicinus marinus]NYZ66321.1 elongation factor G [Spartinivicinus marinus]